MREVKEDQTHFAVLLVEVQFALEVRQMMVVVVMVHHWIRIEHQLEVDTAVSKGDFGVALSASVGEAQFSLLLRSIAEACESNLRSAEHKSSCERESIGELKFKSRRN